MPVTYNRCKKFVSTTGPITKANFQKMSLEDIIKSSKEASKLLTDIHRETERIAKTQETKLSKVVGKAGDFIISLIDRYKNKGLKG